MNAPLQSMSEIGGRIGEWFSAAELAELALPGLSATKRLINRRAQEEQWAVRLGKDGKPMVRSRQGRGGGLEFHVGLLPSAARVELTKRGIVAPEPGDEQPWQVADWSWFEGQSRAVKDEAKRRMAVLGEVELLEKAGQSATAAIAAVSDQHDVGQSTIWNWRSLVEGVAASERLPVLAPRRKGGGARSAIDAHVWSFFKSDFLRASAPTLCSCYRRAVAKAHELGVDIPSERAFRRKLDREVSKSVIMLQREGPEALRQSVPAQRRTVDHLDVLEIVNIDGHTWDVFVDMGDGKPVRPTMVAIQDVRSSKMLAWRLDISENALLTRLCFADLFRNFGIPRQCLLDNGRAFASKSISGGAKTRYRGVIRDEDPTGVLVGLGIEVKWAKPYRGQSKPIERAFRDMCDDIARAPMTEGAYTGNSPTNKPHNYASRAVPFADFEAHVAQGIAAHNARTGRRGRDYNGRSFDQVFTELYSASPVAKATPEQLRMALLTADQKMVNRRTGEIDLYGNRYWSPVCNEMHGHRVTVRFDPEYLHDDVHLYALDGRYIGPAHPVANGRFDNVADAKAVAKREADHRRMVRDAVKAEQLLMAAELADHQASVEAVTTPEPAATRMVHHRGNVAALRKTEAAAPPARRSAAPRTDTVIDRERAGMLRLVEKNS